MLNDTKKTEIWGHMVALPKAYRGHGMTNNRIGLLRDIVWDDKDFWSDIILRHGLRAMSIEALRENDTAIYNHVVGNFWSMLYQTAIEKGVIKLWLN